MSNDELKPAQKIIYELADKYNVPYEIVETILIEFVSIIYFSLTRREPNRNMPLF